MNVKTVIENAFTAMRNERMKTSEQLTLGEMLIKLEPIVEKQKTRKSNNEDEAEVFFDFEYLFPIGIHSWRGSYSELALKFSGIDFDGIEKKVMTVTKFYKLLKNTIGKTLEGYKGGEFLMGKNTPVWVANYSHSGNTAVVDILDKGYNVLIITKNLEY